jgi:uncharacterized protein
MEVKLDKQFVLEVSAAQAWAVLSDIRAVAPCMPGAQITEQTDASHYKGAVKTRIGPASMQFNGTIEVLALDAASRSLQLLGKGADRTGSAASMHLSARIADGPTSASSVLEGQAVVTVSGKLAQFGNRLLVPAADALLAEFANNFRQAAAMAQPPAAAGTADPQAQVVATAPALSSPVPAARAASAELNVLSLAWAVCRHWWRGLFGGKR